MHFNDINLLFWAGLQKLFEPPEGVQFASKYTFFIHQHKANPLKVLDH